jgi:anti-anti-sigma factor
MDDRTVQITRRKVRDGRRLTLSGELTIYTATTLKDRLVRELGEPGLMEIDLGKVTELDSAGFQVLYGLRRACAHLGKDLKISSPSQAVREVFELYNAARHFGDSFLNSAGADM